jgi:hypothetical protein
MSRSSTIVRVAGVALSALVGSAGADIITGNLAMPGTNTSGTFIGLTSSTIFKAVGWTMPGESYTLDYATLAMDFAGGGEAIVSIWSGTPSLPTTERIVLVGPPQFGAGDFQFTPPAPFVMEAGETYWLYVVSVPNPTGSFYWAGTSPTAAPTGLATHVGYIFNGNVSVARNRFEVGGTLADVCYANCDNSTTPPVLNVEDFTCFISEFAAAIVLPHAQQVTHYANCDGSTTAPALNVEDFTCFVSAFAQGCP